MAVKTDCRECDGWGGVEAAGCTCGGSSREWPYAHESGCGAEPCPAGCPWVPIADRTGENLAADYGTARWPAARAAELPRLRRLGWVLWAGSEPHPAWPERHRHDGPDKYAFPVHSHDRGAGPHDHEPRNEAP